MVKALKLRDVQKALREKGCTIISERGPHTKWRCPCGGHTANVPRHSDISPGVVRNIEQRMGCLPDGWLH